MLRHECSALSKLYNETYVVTKPSTLKGDVVDFAVLTFIDGKVPMTSYLRPSSVAIGETFTVKVQVIGGRQDALIVHNKSRECEFCLGSEQLASIYCFVRSEVS